MTIAETLEEMNVFMLKWIIIVVLLISCENYRTYSTVVDIYIYEGHKYLIFRVPGNFGQTFVHDPECICRHSEK